MDSTAEQHDSMHFGGAEVQNTILPIALFTERDWVQHRGLISNMYTRQRKKLKEIKETMEQKHNLRATYVAILSEA